MSKVTLLIVDDSATLRAVVKSVVRRDPDIEVVGEAADAMEARHLIKELDPDVVTLDIEMPGMNGLQFLEKIMTLRPMPVIMLSGTTAAGSENAVTALTSGAFDCVQKPARGNILEALSELPALIKAAATSPMATLRRKAATTPSSSPTSTAPSSTPGAATHRRLFKRKALIAIGSSTGGVDALAVLLSRFPANCPPTLIAQHMPEAFIRSFADRMNRTVAPDVGVAQEGETVRAGQIRFAPGGETDLELTGLGVYRCRLVPRLDAATHCPSVDVLMTSVAQQAKDNALGLILTGMGRDGAEGLLEMRRAGARTFGQDAATSTVYGMPRVAFEIGAVETQLPLSQLADAALTSASREIRRSEALS